MNPSFLAPHFASSLNSALSARFGVKFYTRAMPGGDHLVTARVDGVPMSMEQCVFVDGFRAAWDRAGDIAERLFLPKGQV